MQTHRVEVLVVADDAAMRTMVRLLLEEAGYAVYEAPDGRPALERLYTHAQGMVVLLDLNMPGMDGLAVLQALLTEPTTDPQLATCHRLILTTAQATDTLPPALLALLTQGALTLLPKPFEVEELLQAMAVAASQLHAALPAAPPIPPLPPSTPPVLLSPAADATTAATSLDRPEPRPHPRYPYPQTPPGPARPSGGIQRAPTSLPELQRAAHRAGRADAGAGAASPGGGAACAQLRAPAPVLSSRSPHYRTAARPVG